MGILHRDAGKLDGDAGRGNRTKIARRKRDGCGGRAGKLSRELSLDQIGEAMARVDIGFLRGYPRREKRRGTRTSFGGGFRGLWIRGEKIRVSASSADLAGGRNVKADENRRALSVGEGGAIVEGRILVAIASQDCVQAKLKELGARGSRDFEREIFFNRAGGAACASVRAPMGGIEDDDEHGARRNDLC